MLALKGRELVHREGVSAGVAVCVGALTVVRALDDSGDCFGFWLGVSAKQTNSSLKSSCSKIHLII